MQEINQKLTGQSTPRSTALYMCDVIAATEEYPPTKKSFGFYLCTCFSHHTSALSQPPTQLWETQKTSHSRSLQAKSVLGIRHVTILHAYYYWTKASQVALGCGKIIWYVHQQCFDFCTETRPQFAFNQPSLFVRPKEKCPVKLNLNSSCRPDVNLCLRSERLFSPLNTFQLHRSVFTGQNRVPV